MLEVDGDWGGSRYFATGFAVVATGLLVLMGGALDVFALMALPNDIRGADDAVALFSGGCFVFSAIVGLGGTDCLDDSSLAVDTIDSCVCCTVDDLVGIPLLGGTDDDGNINVGILYDINGVVLLMLPSDESIMLPLLMGRGGMAERFLAARAASCSANDILI